VLSGVRALRGVRYPLVFRETCRSGVWSWAEFFAIPNSLDVIAHSGNRSVKFRDVHYAAIFDFDTHGPLLYDHIAKALKEQRVYLDPKIFFGFWLVRNALLHDCRFLWF
jgi:hypothetical protein